MSFNPNNLKQKADVENRNKDPPPMSFGGGALLEKIAEGNESKKASLI